VREREFLGLCGDAAGYMCCLSLFITMAAGAGRCRSLQLHRSPWLQVHGSWPRLRVCVYVCVCYVCVERNHANLFRTKDLRLLPTVCYARM